MYICICVHTCRLHGLHSSCFPEHGAVAFVLSSIVCRLCGSTRQTRLTHYQQSSYSCTATWTRQFQLHAFNFIYCTCIQYVHKCADFADRPAKLLVLVVYIDRLELAASPICISITLHARVFIYFCICVQYMRIYTWMKIKYTSAEIVCRWRMTSADHERRIEKLKNGTG